MQLLEKEEAHLCPECPLPLQLPRELPLAAEPSLRPREGVCHILISQPVCASLFKRVTTHCVLVTQPFPDA